MRRGEIWWASLREPRKSEPGFRRPVVIVQSDEFNKSLIKTVIVAVITSNLRLEKAPGNVLIKARKEGLTKDSVANVSQVVTLDKSYLIEKVGNISDKELHQLNEGLRLALAL